MDRIRELTEILCKWYRRELEADDALNEIWKLYETEALETLNDPLSIIIRNRGYRYVDACPICGGDRNSPAPTGCPSGSHYGTYIN